MLFDVLALENLNKIFPLFLFRYNKEVKEEWENTPFF